MFVLLPSELNKNFGLTIKFEMNFAFFYKHKETKSCKGTLRNFEFTGFSLISAIDCYRENIDKNL